MKDPVLQLVLLIVVCFLGIALAVTVGVFVVLPLGLVYVVFLIIKHLPTESSAKKLFEQTPVVVWPTFEDVFSALLDAIGEKKEYVVWAITAEFIDITEALHRGERFEHPPLALWQKGSIEEARYKQMLIDYKVKASDVENTMRVFGRAILESFEGFRTHLPQFALDMRYLFNDSPKPPFTVPLIDTIPHIHPVFSAITHPFFNDEAIALGLFKRLREILTDNNEDIPKKLDGARPELVQAFLKDTPFTDLFNVNVPFDIPDSRMMEHCVIVAGAGTGKTQTLGAIIARYLERDNPPALVVVDSTGALVKKIQTLALFNDRLKDRIVIIDPEHTPSPALNMFDISNPRLQGYSPTMKASIETEIVALFNYIFTSAANDLTSRQGTVFSYVVRLVLSIPDANITTLLSVLEEPAKSLATSKYRQFIEKLDTTAQEFFKNQKYYELKGFRDQIAQRVYSLVQVPAFREMFTTTNRIDFYDELQNKGSIILVNTSEMLLKENASPLFGRYVIARTMASAFERAAIPEQQRRPTFLIIDECAPYVDDTFDKLLTRLRQFKLGVCAAFQHMEQVSEKLRSSIASNTSVKLVGGLGYSDSRWLARDMETKPEFLKAQRRDASEPPHWTQLACYVRNYTPQAVSLTIPFYQLENMPQMTSAECRALLDRNRVRVSSLISSGNLSRQHDSPSDAAQAPPAPPNSGIRAPPAAAPPSQTRDDDAASQWR